MVVIVGVFSISVGAYVCVEERNLRSLVNSDNSVETPAECGRTTRVGESDTNALQSELN